MAVQDFPVTNTLLTHGSKCRVHYKIIINKNHSILFILGIQSHRLPQNSKQFLINSYGKILNLEKNEIV